MIIGFLIVLAERIIFGAVVSDIIYKKGYSENWFWGGFFFGILAMLLALTKPDINSMRSDSQGEHHDRSLLQNGGWRCVRCGRINSGYTGTCGCGATKAENERLSAMGKEEAGEIANARAIRMYKELLDSGTITQEEFDKKKAELLCTEGRGYD